MAGTAGIPIRANTNKAEDMIELLRLYTLRYAF